jgi:regulator of protease activity HflC (stomatin/prohibitin superfamily)
MSGDGEAARMIAEARAYGDAVTGGESDNWARLLSLTWALADELERLQRAEGTVKAQRQAEALNELRAELRLTGLTVSSEDRTSLVAIQRILAERAAALLAPTRPSMVCPGCGHELYLDPMDGWRNDSDGFTCVTGVHTDHIALLAPTTENGETT